MDVFKEVKERVQLAEVLALYGATVERNGNIQCPLHDDKTASFRHYPETDSFYCFGCGVGGTVIDFVAAFHNESPPEAAKRLDSDFGLGLFGGDYKPDTGLLEENRANASTVKEFVALTESVFFFLCHETSIGRWVLDPANGIFQSKGRELYRKYATGIEVIEYHREGLCEALNALDRCREKRDPQGFLEVCSEISGVVFGYAKGSDYLSSYGGDYVQG